MTTLPTSCKKCGKPLNLFDGEVCGECEKGADMTTEQAIDIIKCLAWHKRPSEEEIEDAIKTLEQQPQNGDKVSIGVLEQVMWERNIAIEQLKELGYSLGEKIEPQDGDRAVSLNAVLNYLESNADDFPDYHEAIEYVLQLPSIDFGKWAEEHHCVIVDEDVWKDHYIIAKETKDD